MSDPAGGVAGPRILYIITDPMSTRLLRGQLSYLRGAGFHVELASAPGPELDAFGAAEGVAVHELPLAREPSPFKDLRALVATVLLIRSRRPQIVNASTPKAGLLGTLAAWLCRVPVRVYVVRGLRFETMKGFRRGLFKRVEKISMLLATRTIFNSRSLRSLAVQDGLIPPCDGLVLGGGSGNGIDLGRFQGLPSRSEVRADLRLDESAFVVGFVGRLVRDKGFDDLIAAFDLMGNTEPTTRLLIVGDYETGDPVDDVTRAAVAEEERIVCTGWVPEPERLYAAMDVLAFPSYREGLPNGPLEAQAACIPVVGYRATGTIDAVDDGRTGILVPVGAVSRLAEALGALRDDPEKRCLLAMAGPGWVASSFDPVALWTELAATYSTLLTATSRNPGRLSR
jgi:glycosyltransferase involved in cell wall biosynthesis